MRIYMMPQIVHVSEKERAFRRVQLKIKRVKSGQNRFDMDQVIGEALDLATDTVTAVQNKNSIPQQIRPRTK